MKHFSALTENEVRGVNEAAINGNSSQNDHTLKRSTNIRVEVSKGAEDEVERFYTAAIKGNPSKDEKHDINLLVQVSKVAEVEVENVDEAPIDIFTNKRKLGEVLEEIGDGVNPSDSELPSSSAFYRVIRKGGKCNPPGITNDVCEPGTGTECCYVPEEFINRCLPNCASRTRTIIPAGGTCGTGDVCVNGYDCINRRCVIRYGGVCSASDICESGYTCVNGFCGTSSTRTIVPAGGTCGTGDVCVWRSLLCQ
ncbi:hypothetical protein ACHAXA_008828 [Cyclostephanos tholiformis]|uniref:Uncharacterized protein n=1 Tax=Cyclostephanos tholiformis TaxID=382380 RepID=A0ABD3RCV8_9STRA